MAVYERTWRRYDGGLTPEPWRFLVITRYAVEGVFASRLFTAFYAGCALPSLIGLLLVYLSHNAGILAMLGAQPGFLEDLTMSFFQYLFLWQAIPAFFLSVMIGPGLVAPDLSNGALPLYLSRPVDRRHYVLGKLAILVGLLSPVTWVGGLAVWSLQAALEGGSWWSDNLRIPLAYLVGHAAWILVISLLSLAVSAWVRFKPVAVGTLVGVYVFSMIGAKSVNGMTRSHLGDVVDLVASVYVVVISIFDPEVATGIPLWAALIPLVATSVGSLLVLTWKLRAHEVVR